MYVHPIIFCIICFCFVLSILFGVSVSKKSTIVASEFSKVPIGNLVILEDEGERYLYLEVDRESLNSVSNGDIIFLKIDIRRPQE